MRKSILLFFCILLVGCASAPSAPSKYISSTNIFSEQTAQTISESASAEDESSAQTSPDPEKDFFIGNKNTKKVHLPSCSFLPDEHNRIYFESYSGAIDDGYDPCKKCHPDR